MSQLPTTPLAVRWDKMQRWLFFVALIAVMPTLFSWIVGSVTDRGVTWQSLFGGGELIVGALALLSGRGGRPDARPSSRPQAVGLLSMYLYGYSNRGPCQPYSY